MHRQRRLSADERAAVIQVGAVILFGFVIIAMTLYQVQVIPQQNEAVEFNHNRVVQGQVAGLRTGIVSVGSTGSERSVSVDMGTLYPARTMFINPPPAWGTLRTKPLGNISIENASAIGPEIDDFWDGSLQNVSTRYVVYRPNYHVFDLAPDTVYENTLLYHRHRTTNLTESGQLLVRGRTITLVALAGQYNETSISSQTIDLTALSTSSNSVAIERDSGNVTLFVPTTLSNETWAMLLSPEYATTSSGFIRSHTVVDDRLRIELAQAGEPYQLRMALVGFDTTRDEAANEFAYVTDVRGNGTTVQENGTTTLVVEARDRFNNPVTGVALNATTTLNGASVTAVPTDITDPDGRISYRYTAPQNVDNTTTVTGQVDVSATMDAGTVDGSTPENLTLSVVVENTDGSGLGGGGGSTGSNINPNSSDAVVLTGANRLGKCNKDSNNDGVDDCGQVAVTFENLGGTERNVTNARFNFYNIDTQSSNTKRQAPVKVTIENRDIAATSFKSALEGGRLKEFNGTPGKITYASNNGQETVTMTFWKTKNKNNAIEIREGDFFVLSVVFEDGRSATYFVAPQVV